MNTQDFILFVLIAIGVNWLLRWLFLDASFVTSLLASCGTIVSASLYSSYSNNKLIKQLDQYRQNIGKNKD